MQIRTNRDSEGIYAGWKSWPGRKRCVDLGADEDTVRQNVIIAALKAGEEASAFVKGVDCLK